MAVKINNKSDFKINEWSESIALEVPFEFIYYIPLNKEKYVVSYDGHSYINCVRLDDGSLDVMFNDHGLGIGRLKVVRKYFVDDLSFADGVFDVISDDQTDVFLTSGKTFDTYVKTLVVPPYIKGDKGDPMTWETMTENERGELVKDVAEAIDPEMVMTENEKSRQEAEQSRQTAEQQRSTTFNTLKGEMQSAITAGNAAAGNAQKVVDEYDTKVAEQDSKLTELGSKVGSSSIFNSDSRFEEINQWIGEDGNGVQIAPYARSYFFNVQGLKKLHLSLSPLGGSQDFYHYVFFNSEEPGTSSIMAEYSAKENSSEFVGDVEVPEGAMLIGVNVRTDLGYDNDVAICDYGYILEQSVKTADDVKQMENDLSFFGYNRKLEWTNSWIGSDGEEVQITSSARAYFYKVTVGDMIRLSLSAITGQMGSNYYHYAFYNSDQPSANSLMADYSYIRDRGKDLNTTVEVPEGAVLIGISVFNNVPNNISFGKLGDKMESLTELQIKMESVSDMLTKPLDMDLSALGVLTNGQGISEEEAKEAFLGVYIPEDLKTNYIRIDSERFISFKKVSDNSDYGRTPSIDYTRDEAVVYPIFKDYFDTIKKEIVGFVIINASKIVRESYGTKYVYLVGNKGEYCQFRSSYNSVTEIVLLGDSLTALGSGYANFFDVNGCGRTPFGVGGEKPTQIMGRIGVAPFRLKEDIVIPAEPAAVNIKLISSFDNKETYPINNYGLHECIIGGIKGSINVTTAGSAVTFTRSASGEEVILKAGIDIESCYYWKTNTFNVYWMGQNGYGSDDELVDAFKLCVANQLNNYYLVLTPHLNTSDELEQKMQRTFGNRYINMRRWSVLFGLSESGITPTEADMEAIANNQCPPSLLGDGVHFVESARQAIGKMISNKVAYIIGR